MSELNTVLVIVLIIWFGIGGYMFYLDRRVTKLEKDQT